MPAAPCACNLAFDGSAPASRPTCAPSGCCARRAVCTSARLSGACARLHSLALLLPVCAVSCLPLPFAPACSIFLYMFMGVVLLSIVFMALRGRQVWKPRKPGDAYILD